MVSTKYRGVKDRNGRFEAWWRHGGAEIYLGSFPTAELAALAWDAAAAVTRAVPIEERNFKPGFLAGEMFVFWEVALGVIQARLWLREMDQAGTDAAPIATGPAAGTETYAERLEVIRIEDKRRELRRVREAIEENARLVDQLVADGPVLRMEVEDLERELLELEGRAA